MNLAHTAAGAACLQGVIYRRWKMG